MKIHILPYGTLALNEYEMTGQGSQEGTLQFPSYGILVEHEKGLILIDTGCAMDPAFPDRIDKGFVTYTEEDMIENRLGSLGYKPEDIDYVIITHMHIDHAGDFQLFPNATFITAREEYANAIIDENAPTPASMKAEWANPYRKWHFVDRGTESFADDIELINYGPGHSYGMLGVLLKTKDLGDVLVASDIVYNQYTLDGLLPGNVVDMDGFKASVAHVKARADNGTVIWFGHDIDQFATMEIAPSGYYE